MKNIIVSLDQGTSSSRAIAFDVNGRKVAVSQKEFPQIYPKPGWVEHDPEQIWSSQKEVLMDVVEKVGAENIIALGIANQRETTVLWDAITGEPVCNAIVWQDRRTAGYCDFLTSKGYSALIRSKTGLRIDSYFSATKIRWILDNVPSARQKAERGELRFGTVDTFLLWRLTGGKVHATDVTNASRTMLFNIHTLQWDNELLSLMGIPASILPEVKSSSEIYGQVQLDGCSIPVAGVIGDQQSALFAQMCLEKGSVKNTYGTGGFLLMNTGDKAVSSTSNLLSTIAWKIGGSTTYALEGSIFISGAAVQWLRDGLGIIKSSAQVEELASQVEDNGGVYFVPALTGLAAPYWNADARGTIVGLTRATTAAHIARATIEGMALQVKDVVDAMEKDSGMPICELKVDGGASDNDLLLQFQSDILATTVVRPSEKETTALGAAYMAGLAVGVWKDVRQLQAMAGERKVFSPSMVDVRRKEILEGWRKAVKLTLE